MPAEKLKTLKHTIEKIILTGSVIVLTILIIIGCLICKNATLHIETSHMVIHTQNVIEKIDSILAYITDAETGQRGYIITGDGRYLEPYYDATSRIPVLIKDLKEINSFKPEMQKMLDNFESLITEKLSGLKERVELRKTKGFEAAAQGVRTGKGRIVMEKIRKLHAEIVQREWKELERISSASEKSAYNTIYLIIFGSSLAFFVIVIEILFLKREISVIKKTEELLKQAHDNLEKQVEKRTEELTKANLLLNKEIAEREKIEERLRYLSSELTLTEERERKRIATDIHDHISQNLALSKMKLESLRESTSPELVNAFNEVSELVDKTIQYSRSLIFDISPPILYTLGLAAAIEWFAEKIQEQYGINIVIEDKGELKPIDENIKAFLFSATRELLINVVKHSKADRVEIYIQRNDNVQIKVKDNGVGFDIAATKQFSCETGGFGLFSICERLKYLGGYVNIESKLGHGTTVTLFAPLSILS